jgi:hypothetical protein
MLSVRNVKVAAVLLDSGVAELGLRDTELVVGERGLLNQFV